MKRYAGLIVSTLLVMLFAVLFVNRASATSVVEQKLGLLGICHGDTTAFAQVYNPNLRDIPVRWEVYSFDLGMRQGEFIAAGGNVWTKFEVAYPGRIRIYYTINDETLWSWAEIDQISRGCPQTPTPTLTPTVTNTPTPVIVGTASIECYQGRATLHTGAWNRSLLTVRVVVALKWTTWVQLGWLAPGQYGTLNIGMYPNVEGEEVFFRALDSENNVIGTASANYPTTSCEISTATSTSTPTLTATSTSTRTNIVPPTRTPVRGTPTNTATPTTVPVCQFNEEPAVSSGQYTSIGQYRLNLLEPIMRDGIPNDNAWTAVFTFRSLAPTPIIGVMGGWLFKCNADEVGTQCAFAEEDRWYNHQPPVWITKTVTIQPGVSSFSVNLTLPDNNSFVQLDWKTLTLLDSGQILPASHDWKVGVHVKKSPSPVGCHMP